MTRLKRYLFKLLCFVLIIYIGFMAKLSFQPSSHKQYNIHPNTTEFYQPVTKAETVTQVKTRIPEPSVLPSTGRPNNTHTTLQPKPPVKKRYKVAGRFDVNYRQSPRNTKEQQKRYINQLKNTKWKNAINAHLKEHEKMCELDEGKLVNKARPYCPCIPDTLVKYTIISDSPIPSLSSVKEANPDVQEGGHWTPSSCTARMRVAIVIPFRDRDEHLAVLLKYLLPILRGQQLEHSIIVVEQVSPATFNKAVLMNIGYLYANRSSYAPNCVIFHDVDVIPEDGRHFYWCHPNNPIHLGGFHDRHQYRIRYPHIFGAATAFRTWQFEKVNGFSNLFFGWGGEDDDMGLRVLEKGFKIQRDPMQVAGYSVLRHGRDTGNAQPSAAIHSRMRTRLYKHRLTDTDGLNNVKYKIRNVTKLELYTLLQVEVLNEDIFKTYRKKPPLSKSN